MAAHTDLGAFGEVYVHRLLAEYAPVEFAHPQGFDLDFVGISIEVKTARVSKFGGKFPGYQFLLNDKRGHCRLSADVLALVCVPHSGSPVVFFIPSSEVRDLSKVTLPLSLAGRFAPYRFNYDVFADFLPD